MYCSILSEVDLNELAKPTRIVIVNCLRIPESLQQNHINGYQQTSEVLCFQEKTKICKNLDLVY